MVPPQFGPFRTALRVSVIGLSRTGLIPFGFFGHQSWRLQTFRSRELSQQTSSSLSGGSSFTTPSAYYSKYFLKQCVAFVYLLLLFHTDGLFIPMMPAIKFFFNNFSAFAWWGQTHQFHVRVNHNAH